MTGQRNALIVFTNYCIPSSAGEELGKAFCHRQDGEQAGMAHQKACMYVNYSIGRKMGCSLISVADVHNLLPGLKNCAANVFAWLSNHHFLSR